MTRSSNPHILHDIDPEIERTLHSLLRMRKRPSKNFVHTSSSVDHSKNMANNMNRTLKELAATDVTYQPLCIQYPDIDVAFELKSGLIHLLPRFHGLAGEDPHKHLK